MIIVSLELAKRMKAEGWDKPTTFYYISGNLDTKIGKAYAFGGDPRLPKETLWMPTAQEILDELPSKIKNGSNIWEYLHMDKGPNDVRFIYGYRKKGGTLQSRLDLCRNADTVRETLAESLGELWIRAKQNGHLD